MKRRIVALILSLCLTLPTITISFAADNTLSNNAREAYDVLSVLGFIDDGYDEESISSAGTVSRAQFAEFVYKVFFNNFSSDNLYFYDIPISHFASKEIAVLVEQNIISVGSDKLFYPDKSVSSTEAAKMLLFSLGYAQICELNGGWSVGIDKTASELDLCDGISNVKELSYSDMLIMMYNALMTESLEFSGIQGGQVILKGNGETYLSANYNIYVNEGVLAGYDETSVFGDAVGENEVLIDDLLLDSNGIDVSEYLGMRVKYLYKYTDDETTLEWIKPTKKNKSLNLNKFDNEPKFDEDSFSYVYYNDGKRKTVDLTENISVIYNGVYVKSGIADVLKKDFYKIILVSTTGKNNYDVAIIEDYENYILKAVQENLLYLKACDETKEIITINLNAYNRVEIYSTDGVRIEPEDLSNDVVLSVAKSVDDSRIIINVSDKTVSGKLLKINTDDFGYRVFTMENEEFKAFEQKEMSYVVGSGIKLLLDYQGFVVDSVITTDMTQFGYLIKLRYDESEESLRFRIYNQDAEFYDYNAADNLYIDGIRFKENASSAYNYMGGASFSSKLIAFKTNADGDIKLVDFPESAAKAVKTDKNMFTIEETISGTPYDSKSAKLGTKIRLGSNSVVFGIPGDGDRTRFSVGGASNLKHDISYSATAYNYGLEDKEFNDVLVTDYNFEMDSWQGIRILVDKITHTVNIDDEAVCEVEGYRFTSKTSLKFTPEISEKAADLERGDIIYVSDVLEGDIANFDLVYSPRTDVKPANTSYRIAGVRTLMFYVNDIIGTSIRAGYDSGESFDEVVTTQNAKILVYDKDADLIEEGSLTDLVSYKAAGDNCSLVYHFSINATVNMIVVYK